MRVPQLTITLAVFMLFMLLLASPSASTHNREQESTATLQETMDWLGTKLTTTNFINAIGVDLPDSSSDRWMPTGNNGLYYTTNISDIGKAKTSYQVQGCRLDLQMIVGEAIYKVSISFSDIDPLSIKEVRCGDYWVSSACLQAESSRAKKPFETALAYSSPNYSKYNNTRSGSSIQFVLKDDESMKRTETAVKHAVKLCGGKVDPF